MSTTLTVKSPLPCQTLKRGPIDEVTSDEHGLATVTAGSELAKAVIGCGWTVVAALPTVDPGVAGTLWNNGGTLTISAG
jgi:hypothetical protein